jgi:hypothetical protein
MKKLLLSGITAVALMAAGTAQAANAGLSLDGNTGVARTPLAMALPPMTLAVAADYVGSDELFIPARVEFGVIDGLELGGKFWWTDTDAEIKVWGVNAKYVLPIQLVENLAIAVGGGYDTTTFKAGDDVTELNLYGVASYTAMVGEMAIIPSLGVKYDSVDAGDSENGVRVFGSLVAMVMPNLAVGGEFVSTVDKLDGDNADTYLWFGARFMPMDALTVQAGMINNANMTNDGDPSDWVFHAGAQYAFSFGN